MVRSESERTNYYKPAPALPLAIALDHQFLIADPTDVRSLALG